MDSSGLRKVFLKLLIVTKARINDGFCYIGWDLDRYKLARPLLRLHNPRWSPKDDKLRVGYTHLFKVVSFQPAWKRSLASLHRRCSRKTLRTQSTRGGQSLWRWIVHNLIDTEPRNCKKGLQQYGSNQRTQCPSDCPLIQRHQFCVRLGYVNSRELGQRLFPSDGWRSPCNAVISSFVANFTGWRQKRM